MLKRPALQALIEAGAVRKMRLVARGANFHAEVETASGVVQVAATGRGQPRQWRSLDAAARWARDLGVGEINVSISQWAPAQKGLL